jgi:serine/threonine protein phosphatase PrpC
VGDSGAYLLDPDSFRSITEDESWVAEVRRGRQTMFAKKPDLL